MPTNLKQLNKELRRLKALRDKAVKEETRYRYQNEIIRIISEKNKVKKGSSRTPKTPKKKKLRSLQTNH